MTRNEWLRPTLLAVAGAFVVWRLGQAVPEGRGAARAGGAASLLALFDTVWLLALLVPGRAGWGGLVTTVVIGAPFHLAAAAAAGASAGHLAAWSATALAFGAASVVGAAAAPRVHGLAAALLTFAVPLAAYAVAEFASTDVAFLLAASPGTAPTLLARTAPAVAAASAVPALVAAAALLAVDLVCGRRSAGRSDA